MKDDRPDVLLVTVDSLRPDHTGAGGYSRPTTPFLDGLASEGRRWTEAVADAVPTYYGFQAVMASRFPALRRLKLDESKATLATVFRGAGYRTGAFVAANPYVTKLCNYHLGFERFEDFGGSPRAWRQAFGGGGARETGGEADISPLVRQYRSLKARWSWFERLSALWRLPYVAARRMGRAYLGGGGGLFPGARTVAEACIEWLGTAEGPAFAWLHLMDTHHPYTAGRAAMRAIGARPLGRAAQIALNDSWHGNWKESEKHAREKERLRDRIVDIYDAAAREVDEAVNELCRQRGRLRPSRECVTAVVSDHGEQFLEEGMIFHRSEGLREELIRVVALLHAPGRVAPGEERGLFRLMDVAPTILEAAGLVAPASFDGTCRLDGDGPEEVFVAGAYGVDSPLDIGAPTPLKRVFALRGRRFKLVFDEAGGRWAFFDLMADGGEAADAGKKHPELRREMQARLTGRVARLDREEETAAGALTPLTHGLDGCELEEIARRLQDLGYM